jgi:hypothetical protein
MAVSFLPYGFHVTPGSTNPGIRRTSDSGQAACLPTLAADRSCYERRKIVMKPIRRIRRFAAALAGLACAWLGLAVAAPTAFAAVRVPPPGSGPPGIPVLHEPPGWYKHPPLPVGHVTGPVYQVHTVVIGGMPGWQIALIAVGAALVAATVAVLVDRAWTAHRKSVTATA